MLPIETLIDGTSEAELLTFFKEFQQNLLPAFPECQEVITQYKAGSITLQEACREVLRVSSLKEDIAQVLDSHVSAKLVPYVDPSGNIRPVNGRDYKDFLYQPNPDKPLYRLNPFYEGALIERATFDGDVPEARFGPIPDEVMPAVPVDTDSIDPVQVGIQLEVASLAVKEEIKALQETYRLQIEAQLKEQELLGPDDTLEPVQEIPVTNLPVLGAEKAAVSIQLNTIASAPEPEGYQRGQLPALRAIPLPPMSALLSLTEADRQRLTAKTLTTTQGRRSMLQGLKKLVEGHFAVRNIPCVVTLERVDASKEIGGASWTFGIEDPKAISPNFTPVVVAARVLVDALITQIPKEHTELIVELSTVNTYADRQVGWKARLLQK